MADFRSWTTVIANLLVPVGILTFSSGFFPYKPLIPGLATFDETDANVTAPAMFDKVIFMVVDALRSDFVYSNDSGFMFTQSLIRSGAALPFTAYASSPTVTMPRLKAITTGSVPSFLDVILNIAESDTTSTLAYQDTWLAQIKAAGGRLVMYGDDTWLKLFPGMFERADGTTSFFVSDFTEVDHNVTRHVPSELAQDDWSALIMHYLGLDHIGHKAGPKSPFMIPKQHEMDSVVTEIYTAMQQQDHLQSTLFVLCGDHGMNEAGNHGGSSAGETSPALLFMSPKFEALGGQRESPAEPSGDMQYYQTVEQADIAPTLAGLLGIPIPLNSLGVFIPDFLEMWDYGPHKLGILYQNAEQLLNTLTTTFPGSTFGPDSITYCASGVSSGIEGAQCAWAKVQQILSSRDEADDPYSTAGPALLQFLRIAQEVMSRTASNYDVSRLILGLLITGVAGLLVLPATYKECTRHGSSGMFLTLMIITCGMMMFASSYVEEEQQFWYWICSGWIVYLHVKSQSSAKPILRKNFGSLASWSGKCTILVLAITQRILRRWNQTGQKFAAEPDISRTFFARHPEIFWGLFVLTYVDAGRHLLKSISISRIFKLGVLVPVVFAFTFKLHFVTSESPELLEGTFISRIVKQWPYSLSLVSHARLVFYGLAVIVLLALFVGKRSRVARAPHDTIHEALHIFLMTQSRATNVPLFLIFRIQAGILFSMNLTGIEVTITTLIFQYMTFFAFGGSNAISSVDLASGYNGIDSYSVVLVGILTFASNWAGPIWWASQSHRLRPKNPADQNPSALLTFHIAMSLVSVMAACTALRTHLFIWTVFSPKYLYSMAWATANHVAVNLLGEVIFSRSRSHYS
ncbi:Alkaline phosphatase-like alpha/beta/alpha [Penicillium cf. griseofulvum]|uniref:GPI ethanolamine phosphate transferase 2 n=1 Tax=Penicillium cf. griseofulvum TaxID=2972120 RepID=A0A9W9MQH8_9EURO|nr:Alkaline phosphatase-like alpha/beta/alpha [Penicillium cf. griseofulvum]KAJ5441350.1 Alkaline phosphatase-like alpha/beta/alpha [Penicillium cf. griseofulvum]KAJ5449403.1 Alkaline phosphatase-like alpha/beta/alpha [Penicillium cf. griseofulvum]